MLVSPSDFSPSPSSNSSQSIHPTSPDPYTSNLSYYSPQINIQSGSSLLTPCLPNPSASIFDIVAGLTLLVPVQEEPAGSTLIRISLSIKIKIDTVNVQTLQTLFSFCSQIKCRFFMAGIHKMDVRIANKEDPDQTASSEGSALFV